MSKVTLKVTGPLARQAIKRKADEVPEGWVATFSEPVKKRDQEEKYHAQIGDISKQCLFMGKRWSREDWKRLLIDAFAQAMREVGTPLHHDGRVVPSLDHERVVQLGIQSRDFRVKEAAAFIEYLYAWGADQPVPVVWTDPVAQDRLAA
jgi:hypothetical protein